MTYDREKATEAYRRLEAAAEALIAESAKLAQATHDVGVAFATFMAALPSVPSHRVEEGE